MKVKVFTKNKDGKIELTEKELKELLDEVYWEGYWSNSRYQYTWTSPNWWYDTNHITCSSASGKAVTVDGTTVSRASNANVTPMVSAGDYFVGETGVQIQALNAMYTKGYEAGYKMGLQSGLQGSKARLIMERDLIFCYGVMAIVLKEKHGWKEQSISNLIVEIQSQWQNLENETPEGNSETMAEMVQRRTGISLKQMAQDIVDGGWD